jgi:hypothetical protein
MSVDEKKLRSELKNIRNNCFDVKEYFNLLHTQMLPDNLENNLITAPNELIEEESLSSFLSKSYPDKKYVLLSYAHKPHSNLFSPYFPEAPRFHTSLLLCKIKENKIDQILNIDAYNFPGYVDILGERPGATPNPYIKNRLVIEAQPNIQSSSKSPLQTPSWGNLNCSIYALTFAQKILAIHAENPEILDNVFPEEKTLKPTKIALETLEKEILKGMIGTYVTKQKNSFVMDNNARDRHHNATRETLAQNYELQQRAMPSSEKPISENFAPEQLAPAQTETTVSVNDDSKSNPPHVPSGFGFFSPPKSRHSEPEQDSLNKLSSGEIFAINKLIAKLNGEIHSKCWLFPNKDRKKTKVLALKSLIEKTNTMEVNIAIEILLEEFQGVRDGHISSRTADLLDRLSQAHKPVYSAG